MFIILISELDSDQLTNEQMTALLFEGISDNGENGDIIFVFGSNKSLKYRAPKAIELYKMGRSQKILFSGGTIWIGQSKTEAELMKDNAMESGIPEENILMENQSKHTKENILASLVILDRVFMLHHINRIIVVTTAYHMRRTLLTLKTYLECLSNKKDEIIPRVINSAFHLLMLNKSFLKDFHEAIAIEVSKEERDLSTIYPNKFTKDNKAKRVGWPVWLKKGLFYRDRGVCVSCRSDLTGVINHGDSFEIDHIVPISRYGTNDSSNLQILCKACNIEKLNHTREVSVYDVPLWDYAID